MVICKSKQTKLNKKMKTICICHAESLASLGVEYLTTGNADEIEIRERDYQTYEIDLGLDTWELV